MMTKVCMALFAAVGSVFVAKGKEIVREGPDLGLPFSVAVKDGRFIHVAGQIAVDAAGKVIPGGIQAQTRGVLDRLSSVLAAAGSDLAHVASVNVYLKNAADFAAMNEVYRTYFPKDPPVRATIVSDLVLPEGLVEMSMIALPRGAERRVIHPPGWINSPNPYSYGIQSGDTLFLAGMVSRRGRDNTVNDGDFAAQMRTVLDNCGEVLKAAGMDFADVVVSRVYLPDPARFQEMNAIYRTVFPKDPPARATVRAGLMSPVYAIEISMTAVKSAARQVFVTPTADGRPGTANPNLSSAVRVGNRLYVSGMLGNSEATRDDVKAQTRETLVRLGRTLRAAGFDWADVVDSTVFLKDARDFGPMNEAYRETFTRDYPARATVGNALMAADGLVEIMLVAAR
jgi:enamine deaminase RidA (YjgF/YER057c/UK114 family)